MKRIPRLAAVAGLVGAATVAVGAQPASAELQGRCDPPEGEPAAVRTCINAEYSNYLIRPRGSIFDVAGGTNFKVDIDAVRLERKTSTGWAVIDDTTRWEIGYHDDSDGLIGDYYGCTADPGRDDKRTIRAAAHYRWQNPSGDPFGEWMHTAGVVISCTRT